MNDGFYIKKELATELINKYGTNLINISEKISVVINDVIDDNSRINHNSEPNFKSNSSPKSNSSSKSNSELNSNSRSRSSSRSRLNSNSRSNSRSSSKTNSSFGSNLSEKITENTGVNQDLDKEKADTMDISINRNTKIKINVENNNINVDNPSLYYDNLKYDNYNENMINKITNRITSLLDNEKKITLSITTCKRLNLFKRTINSFINCCKDILLVDEYLCIDDNSSQSDRDEMMKLYPFFKWIMKTPEQKGHMQSMNIIINEVNTEYLLHMEDDWLFCVESEYITPALEILNQKSIKSINIIPLDRDIPNKKIAQVVFNKNYTELQENEVQGGFLCTTNENGATYLIHEHYNPNEENELYEKEVKKYNRSAMYWPHFSLQPSLLKTEIFKQLGNFVSEGFFERNYANKYYKNGYITCFLNRVSCRHIGKLLSQRNDPNIKNAYELNQVNQFDASKNVDEKNKNNGKQYNKEQDSNNEIDNYIFFENKDSYDYDILLIPNKSVRELKNIADSLPTCVGFNTLGYLKYKISDVSNFIFLPNIKNNPEGLYIKKINY